MPARRRLPALLVALALVTAPAVALRATCAGKSCSEPPPAGGPPPFCGLPQENRALIAAGFRDGRSPDVPVFGRIATEVAGVEVGWSMSPTATRVPLVFVGMGVSKKRLPPDVTLDRIAPTLEAAARIRRPHPETRSGKAISGLIRPRGRSPLLAVIVWKGVGSATLEHDRSAWPELRALMHAGASTLGASTGSVPVDPAAVLSTIGSGAVPSHHGVTGTLVRTDTGAVVAAWSSRAPLPVIAFLGDDLDTVSGERARIGLVGADPTDRGLIGGRWYLGHDRDDVAVGGDPLRTAGRLLDDGFGAPDGVVDLLAVSLRGRLGVLDRTTGALVRLVRSRVPNAMVVITATGSGSGSAALTNPLDLPTDIEREVGVPGSVRAVGPAGVFIDTDAAVSAEATSRAIERVGEQTRTGLVAFPGYAVTLQRFC